MQKNKILPSLVFGILFILSILLIQSGCKRKVEDKKTELEKFSIQSTSFNSNDSIPYTFSCLNPAQVFPELEWKGVSSKVKSFAIIMDDTDAIPVAGYTWNHWVLYDIPGDVRKIEQGKDKNSVLPIGTIRGKTSFGDTSYGGPCPPPGQNHHYTFRLFALNIENTGLGKAANAAELRQAIVGKIVDSIILTGTFKR